MKVSPTSVIEAIRRLQQGGLITVALKWGASVKERSWDEIVEDFHIRRGLEGETAEIFVKRATPEDKKRLAELNGLLRQCALTDTEGFADADMELHLHVARSTRFPELFQLVENTNIERTAILGLLLKVPGNELDDCEENQ
jgi:DNA-binding GntR family transcriptional regulator